MKLTLVILGLVTGLTAKGLQNAGDPELLARYPNFLVLISNTYELYWNYTEGNSRLDVAVRVKTTGWVGLGVSERGNMVNSDLAVGWVTDEGEATLKDRYAGVNGFPPEDTRHDLNLIRGEEKHGWTTLEFWRYLDTGDTGSTGGVNHDRIITEGSTPVIFAYGDSDTFSYHMSRRGSVGVYFLGEDKKAKPSAKTLDVLVRNITVPGAATAYWCAGFRLSQEIRSSVKHMIGFFPVIYKPAASVVHHMILYSCDEFKFGSITDDDVIGDKCYMASGQPGTPLATCLSGNVVAAWAAGGEAYEYPDGVSFPFGGPQSSEYWMLQVHYDNPSMIADIIDCSGFQITYLDTPLKYDAGALLFGSGVFRFMVIPPKMDTFDVYVMCDSSCTAKNFPEEGITVFANLLHTHLAGHGLVLKQYRNGVEVTPPIDQDLNYDFNFQQIRTIPLRKIYPGDKLELTCKYRTLNRNSTVFGGPGTSEEMCLVVMYYYPKSLVKLCGSRLKLRHVLPALKIDHLPSVNLSAPTGSIVRQVFGVELRDPNFPWDEESRIQNLRTLSEASRTNTSYSDHICSLTQ